MNKLYLSIVSPDQSLFEGEVKSVRLPGAMGTFTILPQHAPIVSSLKAGNISYVVEDVEQTLTIKGGFVEMSNDSISVCVEC